MEARPKRDMFSERQMAQWVHVADPEPEPTAPEPTPEPEPDPERDAAWWQARQEYLKQVGEASGAPKDRPFLRDDYQLPRNGGVKWMPDGMGGMWIHCELTGPPSSKGRNLDIHISAEDLPEMLKAVRQAAIVARGRPEESS